MQVTSSKKEIWTVGSYSLLTLSIMVGYMYLNTFATEVLLIPAEKRFRLYHFRQPIYLQWSLDRSGLQQCISSIFSFAAQPRRSAARPVRMQTGFLRTAGMNRRRVWCV